MNMPTLSDRIRRCFKLTALNPMFFVYQVHFDGHMRYTLRPKDVRGVITAIRIVGYGPNGSPNVELKGNDVNLTGMVFIRRAFRSTFKTENLTGMVFIRRAFRSTFKTENIKLVENYLPEWDRTIEVMYVNGQMRKGCALSFKNNMYGDADTGYSVVCWRYIDQSINNGVTEMPEHKITECALSHLPESRLPDERDLPRVKGYEQLADVFNNVLPYALEKPNSTFGKMLERLQVPRIDDAYHDVFFNIKALADEAMDSADNDDMLKYFGRALRALHLIANDCGAYDGLSSIYRNPVGLCAMAYQQASQGKGLERHANGLPFHEQPMQTFSEMFDSSYGMAFQAAKKINEGRTLPTADRKLAEFLGAINYMAGIVIFGRRRP